MLNPSIVFIALYVCSAVWVPEIGYSVDLLFRRALKLQQEAKDSEKVTSVESASTKRSTPSKALHLVEELEHFLTKEAGVTSLPYYQAMWTLKSTVFDGMVFWIKGYDQEVHKSTIFVCSVFAYDSGLSFR